MKDDTKKELERRLVQAQADVSQKRQETMLVAENVYVNPRRAVTNMMAYSSKHGDEGLLARLEKDPAGFGTMKGHIGSGNALSFQGMRDKGISKNAAKSLAGMVKTTIDADNKALGLERALGLSAPAPSRSKGKDGIDFT